MTTKKRVTAYCRVSTTKKDQLSSYEHQMTYFRREISNNPDMELIEPIYADRGITGTSLHKRPEFNRMLEDAGFRIQSESASDVNPKEKHYHLVDTGEPPKFDLIVVTNTSRFARNILAVEILRLLKKKGVFVRFLDIDKTTENDDDMGWLPIFMTFDERESRDKSRKVRFGQGEGAKAGNMSANSKLYGFTYDTSNRKLSRRDDEAAVVKKIFELYSTGLGIRRILNYLKDNGHKTRAGKDFTKTTVSKILENPKYCGTLVRNRYSTGEIFDKHYPKERDRKEWVTVPNHPNIDKIIDQELFQKCQEIRTGKVNYETQKGKNARGKSKFAGLIICGKCGGNYIANADRGRKFYNCANKKAHGTKAPDGCASPNVSVTELQSSTMVGALFEFDELVVQHKEEQIDRLLDTKLRLEAQINHDNHQLIAETMERIAKLDKQRNSLLEFIDEEGFDKEEVIRRTREKAQEISALQAKVHELSKPEEALQREILQVNAAIDRVWKLHPEHLKQGDNIRDEIESMTVLGVDMFGQTNFDIKYKAIELIKKHGLIPQSV